MKIKRYALAFMAFVVFFLFLCLSSINLSAKTDSIINTDENLGIFRDLTKEEIKQYYSDLEKGNKGEQLLANLQPILKKNQVKLNYNSGSTKSTTWDGYYLLDRDWVKSPLTETEIATQKYSTSNIWLDIMYSSYSILIGTKINSGTLKWEENGVSKSVAYENGKVQFDREHVFPKSYGFNGASDRYKDLTTGCDMQNLHAAEHVGNNSHSNYPYGTVASKTSNNKVVSGITGEVVGYVGTSSDGITVFEPLDEDKGDIARSIFYMCARYHTYEELGKNDNTPALTLTSTPNRIVTTEPEDTKTSPAAYGDLDDLLKWNKEDPVSESEIHRNNLCYNAIQYNRNPFIDYPAWADIAFGDSEKGIDLSYDDGVASSADKASLDIEINTSSLYKGDILDTSEIIIKYLGSPISLSSVNVDVTTPNGECISNVDLSSYAFSNIGSYVISFSYVDLETSYKYEKTVKIDILSKYSIKAKTDNINLKIDAYSKFNFDGLVVTRYYLDSNPVELSKNDYTIEIYDKDGNKLDFDNEYIIKKLGDYTVVVKSTIDGDTIETIFSINVTMPKIIIIIAVIVIVIIILAALIFSNQKKKKNKKKNSKKTKKNSKK